MYCPIHTYPLSLKTIILKSWIYSTFLFPTEVCELWNCENTLIEIYRQIAYNSRISVILLYFAEEAAESSHQQSIRALDFILEYEILKSFNKLKVCINW